MSLEVMVSFIWNSYLRELVNVVENIHYKIWWCNLLLSNEKQRLCRVGTRSGLTLDLSGPPRVLKYT